MMSVKGKKVLHIDRNDHYGGYGYFTRFSEDSLLTIRSEAASVNIESASLTKSHKHSAINSY